VHGVWRSWSWWKRGMSAQHAIRWWRELVPGQLPFLAGSDLVLRHLGPPVRTSVQRRDSSTASRSLVGQGDVAVRFDTPHRRRDAVTAGV
jgi:hypothetical protein